MTRGPPERALRLRCEGQRGLGESGRCRSDSGTHQTSTELVAEAIGSLQRAGQECCSVGAHLEAAQAAASHLAVLTDDDFEPRALNPRASMEPTGRKEQSR